MRTDILKNIVAWLPFSLGLTAGLALAFLLYAGLQPRLQKAVLAQQDLKAKAAAKDTAAAAKKPNEASAPTAPASSAASRPATTITTKAATTTSPATASKIVRLTTLAPTNPTARTANPWPAVLLLMAAALAAAGMAWRQYRQQPQPPGAITSPVLEALFTLSAHRDMLQKTLALSPRQIKRFSSKARVQHSQLRALARPAQHRAGIPFSIDSQIKAFQLLLLLEENRRQPQRFPQNDVVAFISQVQAAYIGHPELTTALLEAYAHPVISTAKSKEGFALTPDPTAEARFLRQLFEMNAGLLA